jgi:hypothetical protein
MIEVIPNLRQNIVHFAMSLFYIAANFYIVNCYLTGLTTASPSTTNFRTRSL